MGNAKLLGFLFLCMSSEMHCVAAAAGPSRDIPPLPKLDLVQMRADTEAELRGRVKQTKDSSEMISGPGIMQASLMSFVSSDDDNQFKDENEQLLGDSFGALPSSSQIQPTKYVNDANSAMMSSLVAFILCSALITFTWFNPFELRHTYMDAMKEAELDKGAKSSSHPQSSTFSSLGSSIKTDLLPSSLSSSGSYDSSAMSGSSPGGYQGPGYVDIAEQSGYARFYEKNANDSSEKSNQSVPFLRIAFWVVMAPLLRAMMARANNLGLANPGPSHGHHHEGYAAFAFLLGDDSYTVSGQTNKDMHECLRGRTRDDCEKSPECTNAKADENVLQTCKASKEARKCKKKFEAARAKESNAGATPKECDECRNYAIQSCEGLIGCSSPSPDDAYDVCKTKCRRAGAALNAFCLKPKGSRAAADGPDLEGMELEELPLKKLVHLFQTYLPQITRKDSYFCEQKVLARDIAEASDHDLVQCLKIVFLNHKDLERPKPEKSTIFSELKSKAFKAYEFKRKSMAPKPPKLSAPKLSDTAPKLSDAEREALGDAGMRKVAAKDIFQKILKSTQERQGKS